MNICYAVKSKIRIDESSLLIKENGLFFFFKESFRYLFWQFAGTFHLYQFFLPKITSEINDKLSVNRDVERILDLAYSFEYFGLTIRPGQVREEIARLLSILKSELKPKRIMELGTNNGGTLFLLCQVAFADSLLISLDLPGGKFGGGYPEWKAALFREFAKKSQTIHLVTGNSHEEETLRVVNGILGGAMLDFLLIDGDHTYEGVKQDFLMYAPLVRKGGIVAFHDIAKNSRTKGCNVHDFWNEIKGDYSMIEIVKDWDQGWCGIGVLFV
jgi:predicted O-methyltransferase YrrM